MKEHKNFTFFSIFAEDSIDTLDIFYGVGGVWGQGSLRVTSDAVQCCIYHHKVNGMFWYVDFEQSDTKLTPVIISKSGMIVRRIATVVGKLCILWEYESRRS